MIDTIKIKCLMIEQDKKQKDICNLLNMDERTLSNRLKNSNWKFGEIWRVSQYLGVDIKELIKEEDLK